ncbi:MAG: preprotein translocase subunit SecE [Bacteroidetes bacterium HGW-Bacteroidetes-21]|nr:MAG: preprotein translocase subunit SecE [Bacteroidetes bacterium HGW-Bacteroidetes-21]
MSRIKSYIQESVTELVQKVSWPTAKELQDSAIIVMIASIIIALIIFIMDFLFNNLMQIIYGMFY